MKRITTLLLSCLVSTGPLLAQQGVTQCGTPTGQAPFPIQSYKELPDPVAPSEKRMGGSQSPSGTMGKYRYPVCETCRTCDPVAEKHYAGGMAR